ncbi:MAG: glycosyltransferase [Bacteroidota bacterium]
MRILFVGNPGNTGYRFVRWLRERNVEASLAIPNKPQINRNSPEWENRDLENGYPDWIIKFSDFFIPYIYPPWKIRKLAARFDLLLTAGEYIIPMLVLNKPLVILPVGGDMTRLPFNSKSFRQELHSYLFRKRIGKVKNILTEQEDVVWASKLLGQGDKIIRYPFLVDIHQLQNNVNTHLLDKLKDRYKHSDGLIFHPTRKNLDPNRIDYKGNDKLLRAFKQFIEDYPEKHICMISGLHGRHAEWYKEMVKRLGMEQQVDFIDHLPLPDLHAYMGLDRMAVFDQFTHNLNTLGGIQREALAFGKPVVSSTDIDSQEFIETYGRGCPLRKAFSEEHIYQSMGELFNYSAEEWDRSNYTALSWVEKYLHWENRIDEFISILKRTIEP